MTRIGAAKAKARLGKLLDRVEQGEEIAITRRGTPVARVIGLSQQPSTIDVEAVSAFLDTMPEQTEAAGEFM